MNSLHPKTAKADTPSKYGFHHSVLDQPIYRDFADQVVGNLRNLSFNESRVQIDANKLANLLQVNPSEFTAKFYSWKEELQIFCILLMATKPEFKDRFVKLQEMLLTERKENSPEALLEYSKKWLLGIQFFIEYRMFDNTSGIINFYSSFLRKIIQPNLNPVPADFFSKPIARELFQLWKKCQSSPEIFANLGRSIKLSFFQPTKELSRDPKWANLVLVESEKSLFKIFLPESITEIAQLPVLYARADLKDKATIYHSILALRTYFNINEIDGKILYPRSKLNSDMETAFISISDKHLVKVLPKETNDEVDSDRIEVE